MKAKEIMIKDIVTMKPEMTVFQAIEILVKNKISGAPVLDDNGKIIGVISEKDLLVSFDFIGKEKIKEIQIKDFMTKDVVVFNEEADVKEILQVLVRNNIKRVPIENNGQLVGIVARRDILENAMNF